MDNLTPREIVRELDRFIVGQDAAKRAVAVALRNRYRRSCLSEQLQEEIIPKNILMIGPTGVGKTEIARRLSKLVHAPFIKIEATKFTEVGYVGRDVEAIIRDLVEIALRMVKVERADKVQAQAAIKAEQRLIELLVPGKRSESTSGNPFQMLFGQTPDSEKKIDLTPEMEKKRKLVADRLQRGTLKSRLLKLRLKKLRRFPICWATIT